MVKIYKLQNQIKHYEWGCQNLIPDFLGLENPDLLPWAEMWMGTHQSAPSLALRAGTQAQDMAQLQAVPLSQLLAGEGLPSELPFLFKVLAIEKPLSLQAHPDREQAVQGFRRENEKGLSIDDPSRNYRDENPKPEILCAISPLTVMVGFRQPQEIICSLKALQFCAPGAAQGATDGAKTVSKLIAALEKERTLEKVCALETGARTEVSSGEEAFGKDIASAEALQNFFNALFQLSKQEIEDLSAFVSGAKSGIDSAKGISLQQLDLLQNFARQYPGDPAFLAPLFLNLFTLRSYQAIYIPSGVLHSYIKGFGVELMSNSDNVLRGGLTPKHVDSGELFNILDFNPYMPPVLTPPVSGGGLALSLLRGKGQEIIFSQEGASLCLVIEGELNCNGKSFKKGESFFAAQKEKAEISFSGSFSLFAASACSVTEAVLGLAPCADAGADMAES